MGATGFETFVHRYYAELFASVPAIAAGSIAAFMVKDRLSGEAVPLLDDALLNDALFNDAADPVGADTDAGATCATLTGTLDDALNSWLGADPATLRPDEELALIGVLLAAMAEGVEHDPLAYPALAVAAARLVPEATQAAGRRGWSGLTERAHRAAVDVLRPLALSTLVRAATWELV